MTMTAARFDQCNKIIGSIIEMIKPVIAKPRLLNMPMKDSRNPETKPPNLLPEAMTESGR